MAEHERTDQFVGRKSKMAPRHSSEGRDWCPTPNPPLAGGGTNPKIAREQDRMVSEAHSEFHADQFVGKS